MFVTLRRTAVRSPRIISSSIATATPVSSSATHSIRSVAATPSPASFASSSASSSSSSSRAPTTSAATSAKPAAATPPSTSTTLSSKPPPMQLPSFIRNGLDWIRSKVHASNNFQAMTLYQFTLLNPLGQPTTSKALQMYIDLNPKDPIAKRLALAKHDIASDGLTLLRLPNDELTRYRLIGLHMWLLQKLLLTSLAGADTMQSFIHFQSIPPLPASNSSQRQLIQVCFEHFWSDLTPFLKSARGEMKLTKTIRSVQEYFYGAFVSMDLAWMKGLDTDMNASDAIAKSTSTSSSPRDYLAAALWRNYYLSDTSVSKRDVYRFMYYIHRQMVHLSSMPIESLWVPDTLRAYGWLSTDVVFDKKTGGVSDKVLCEALGITPAAWIDPSFDTWHERILYGQQQLGPNGLSPVAGKQQ